MLARLFVLVALVATAACSEKPSNEAEERVTLVPTPSAKPTNAAEDRALG